MMTTSKYVPYYGENKRSDNGKKILNRIWKKMCVKRERSRPLVRYVRRACDTVMYARRALRLTIAGVERAITCVRRTS